MRCAFDHCWQFRACTVPHAHPYLDRFGFAMRAVGRKFVQGGDAGSCKALRDLADMLLRWCYRLDRDAARAEMIALPPSPQQIVDRATDAGENRLLLTHLRCHTDTCFAPDQATTTPDWNVAEDLATFGI